MKTILYLVLLVAAAGYYGSEAIGPQRTTNAEHGWTDDDWTTDDYEGRTTDDNGGWTDDDYVTDDYDGRTTHDYDDDNKGWVSCGCHDAPSCRQCGSQPHLCNGDCTWTWSGCRRKHGPGPSRPPPPPTGETPVSMGTRPPPTWETPVHISRPRPTGESRPPPSGGPRPPPTGEPRPPPTGESRPPPSRPSRPPPSGGSRPPPTGESGPPPTGPDGTTAEGSTAAPLPSGQSEITVRQTWCQEKNGYDRRAIVRQPTTSTPGQKVPLVVCLHGNGGQANLAQWRELWDKNLIVAAEGYSRSWNIFKETSKAPDVEFINALIAKVGQEHSNADMDNVVLVGYSNGAGMIHRLLVETPNPRPFHKVFPMASTLTQSMYNNDKFWKSSSVDCEAENNFDITVIPAAPGPEIYTIQGTNDGSIPYTGGPGVAGNTFLAAQDTLFLYAKALFGYTGIQLADSAGEATSVENVLKYSYLDGKVNHYKVIGGTHGDTSRNIWPIVKAIINP